jgi:hypothetical protein
LITGLGLTLLTLMGFWLPEATAQKRGGKLVYGLSGDPYSPAPYVFGGLPGMSVNGAQHNSLLRINTEGELVPELAEYYEIGWHLMIPSKCRRGKR